MTRHFFVEAPTATVYVRCSLTLSTLASMARLTTTVRFLWGTTLQRLITDIITDWYGVGAGRPLLVRSQQISQGHLVTGAVCDSLRQETAGLTWARVTYSITRMVATLQLPTTRPSTGELTAE